MGLTVCKGLIEAHSGRIWAENRPGGGALFRFTLPLLTMVDLLTQTRKMLA
jgi:two-component system sensor histidine kinase KdpD